MRAILLAAGRGRRLEIESPKVLVDVGGKTLLERHLVNMVESGITQLTVVVGFRKEMIAAALSKHSSSLEIELVENPDFVRGSILSLQKAAHRFEAGAVFMDADVLYPPALLRRLVGSAHESCALLDGRSEETGEEMMLGTRGGRVLKVARRVGPDWDVAGESVGFYKLGREAGAVMKELLDAECAAGRVDQEYEAALDTAFGRVPFGFERVDDLPWTEIDFQEDVEKARQLLARM